MKLTVIFTVLFALAPAARGETFGYMDSTRVYAESTEAQRAFADVKQDHDVKQKDLDDSQASITKLQTAKAKQTEIQAALIRVQRLLQKNNDDFKAHEKKVRETLQKHLAAVCDKLKAERHLAHILPVLPADTFGPDLTDEVIKRWNAADVDLTADENARLKARIAELEAKAAPPAKDAPKK